MAQMTRAALQHDLDYCKERLDRMKREVREVARELVADGSICVEGANRHLGRLGIDGVSVKGSVGVTLEVTLHFDEDERFADEDEVRAALQDWLDDLPGGEFNGVDVTQDGEAIIEAA